MNRQFLLFKSLGVFVIASAVYGARLPTSITSRYAYCYELMYFTGSTSGSPHPNSHLIDNVCMDSRRSKFHFLSSAQGGTISYIEAPKQTMTVTFLVSTQIGIKADCVPVMSIYCQFKESAHVSQIYNDIYRGIDLFRHDHTIGRIERLILDKETCSQIVKRQVDAQPAGIYTQFHGNMRLIFTFKQESVNGDAGNAVLVHSADMFNISDVLVNNNIVLRFNGYPVLAVVMTFHNRSEAINFRNGVRRYVNRDIAVQIPPSVHEVLQNSVV